MKRALQGSMIGTMAGIATAVGLHMLLSAQPSLAGTGLGVLLASFSAPGARLIGAITGWSGSHELGMLAHWLSLQLTLLAAGGVLGALAGIVTGQRRQTPPRG
mgnify:CR=1 FL=1